jgi:hypothetical protein
MRLRDNGLARIEHFARSATPRPRQSDLRSRNSRGFGRSPEQAQAKKAKERSRRTIDPAFGGKVKAAHR